MDKPPLQVEEQHLPPSVQALDIRFYHDGDEIIRERQEVRCFFVILSGRVRITQHGKRIRLLAEQDVFGLENLLTIEPSPYSATSFGKSRIAQYGPEALDYLIRKSPRMVHNILLSTLQQLTQTTQHLSEGPDSFTLEDVRIGFYSDGQVILDEHFSRNEFYRLVSTQGGLKVTVRGAPIARIERPGEFFGGIASPVDFPEGVTISSIGQSVVETYSLDELHVIVKSHPEIAVQIMHTLVSRLMEANRQSSGTSKK